MNICNEPKLIAIGQLNDKCQDVIPKDAREAIGIGPGDRVVIALAPFDGALVIMKPEAIEMHINKMVKRSTDSIKGLRQELNKLDNKDIT